MTNVLEWLEEAARRSGESVFVSDVEEELTYGQVLRRAREVGSYLCEKVAPRVPVALYLEKSSQATCAMLGAAYAGCPYAFLDVRQPKERLAHVMATLRPAIVLTDGSFSSRARELLGETGVEIADICDIPALTDKDALEAIRSQALDTDPLYVNFTSGSTGTPKGVAVCHRSVIDFIGCFTDIFGLTSKDRIANQAPFDFDVSVKDVYGAMSTGAQLHLIPRDYFSEPAKLMDFLADREVTVCTWAVSAMCFVSIMGGFEYRVPATIRRVMFSGEVMPPKQLAKWQRHLPNAMFVNLYGPTEVTCNCTYHVIDRTYEKNEVIPAGRPFPNERVMLIDERGEIVTQPDVQGEVCVCGTCLALGYYNAPEATAAAFVQNPLNTAYPEVMYRTGDIGIWNEDGELVYIARKDHQIKHLGQRIELGEIESVAQAIDGVSRACCIYDKTRKRISLFYTGELDRQDVSSRLRELLPSYMVPGRLRQLDAMPLTKNGKIDRAALADMKGDKR